MPGSLRTTGQCQWLESAEAKDWAQSALATPAPTINSRRRILLQRELNELKEQLGAEESESNSLSKVSGYK
jgi:hypothetical protein